MSGCAGPPCSYVGHPLTEQIGQLRPNPDEQKRRGDAPPVLLVLPGSRRSEIRHHMTTFGVTLSRLQAAGIAFEAVLPTMPHLQETVIGGGESLEGAAAHRHRRAGKARRVPDRACGARQIRHGDAGARAGRRADGDGLSHRRDRSLHSAARDQGQFRDPGQSRDRRERRSRNSCSRIAPPENWRRRCAKSSSRPTPRRKQIEAFAKLDAIMSTGNQPPSVRAADIVLAEMRKTRRVL